MKETQPQQFRNLERMLQAMDVDSFTLMAQNLNLLLIVMDQELKLQYGNDIFFNMVGWKPDEVLNKDYVKNFIPVEMSFLVRTTLREIINKNTTNYNGSNPVLTYNRGVRHVNWNSIHLSSPEGQTEGMLCVGVDITENNSLKNILGQADYEKSIILENISEAIVYHDKDGRINWVNKVFLEAVGISRQSVVGSFYYHLFSELEHSAEQSSICDKTPIGSIKYSIVKFPDGSEWLSKNFSITEEGIPSRKIMRVMSPIEKHRETSIQRPIIPKQGNSKNSSLIISTNKESIYEEGIGVFSHAMEEVMRQARIIQEDRTVPVLIEGETGTGKEIVARFIHNGQKASNIPFVDINCAAITPTIFESDLFGYEGGSFTGGRPGGQKGKLDIARGGTLFLDEIGEIPISIQAKLLRVIQEKEYFRVGGLTKHSADVRLICATNVNLEDNMQKGTFRRDLFYRLETFRIHIPALRERRDDILPLSSMFLLSMAMQKAKHFSSISNSAAEILLNHPWPGNVRQLKNVIERVVLMWDDYELKPEHLEFLESLPQTEQKCPEQTFPLSNNGDIALPKNHLNLQKLTDNIIVHALNLHQGNKTQTAKYLGLSRRSLSYRLKQMEKKL